MMIGIIFMKYHPRRIYKISKVSPEEGRGELIESVGILTPPLGIGRTAHTPQPTQPNPSEENIPIRNW